MPTTSLKESVRPKTLSDVVGQPSAVAVLQSFIAAPYSTCWLLEGPPGTGKTSSAYALANDLGIQDEMLDVSFMICSELGIDAARALFDNLRLRPMTASPFRVLILEELERLSPQTQTFLKVALENLPSYVVVIATSNCVDLLAPALVERFVKVVFDAGESFAQAAKMRLIELWSSLPDAGDLPDGWDSWGRTPDGEFSLRLALNRMQVHRHVVAGMAVADGERRNNTDLPSIYAADETIAIVADESPEIAEDSSRWSAVAARSAGTRSARIAEWKAKCAEIGIDYRKAAELSTKLRHSLPRRGRSKPTMDETFPMAIATLTSQSNAE